LTCSCRKILQHSRHHDDVHGHGMCHCNASWQILQASLLDISGSQRHFRCGIRSCNRYWTHILRTVRQSYALVPRRFRFLTFSHTSLTLLSLASTVWFDANAFWDVRTSTRAYLVSVCAGPCQHVVVYLPFHRRLNCWSLLSAFAPCPHLLWCCTDFLVEFAHSHAPQARPVDCPEAVV
jgi:hypothetical protein